MPAFLKPAVQQQMAAAAAQLTGLNAWCQQSKPQLLRQASRRYFGKSSVFRRSV